MCNISMDSSRQALQTNGKLFPNFGIIFESTTIFLNSTDSGGGGSTQWTEFTEGQNVTTPVEGVVTCRGSKVKWLSSVVPRILGVLLKGATLSPIHTCLLSQNWWISKVKKSRWISEEQWPVVSHFLTTPGQWKVSWRLSQPPQCWEQKPAAWSHQHV